MIQNKAGPDGGNKCRKSSCKGRRLFAPPSPPGAASVAALLSPTAASVLATCALRELAPVTCNRLHISTEMDTMWNHFLLTDRKSILSHLNHTEKQLKLKRRWLMGLPLTKSQQRKFSEYSLSARSVAESLLRKDDVFYETVKRYVEEAFGACEADSDNNVLLNTGQFFEINTVTRIVLSCLDSLTNKGLYLIAMLLTRGSSNFEKTRKKMKITIRESLPKFLLGQKRQHGQPEVCAHLFQLLSNPKNFQEDCLTSLIPSLRSHYAAAIRTMDRLEDLKTESLHAMHRKLTGVPAAIPCLKRKKYKGSRDELIHEIRKTSEKMLSGLHGGDELPEPLAKALAVAGLSLKLNAGWSNSSVTDFNQFSAETKALQNQIAKAIGFLRSEVRFPKLNTLRLLLDPNADVSNRSLRNALKKLLVEYLFECSDLETVPKPLAEALLIINGNPQTMHRQLNLRDEIEKDVECILNLSADLKQIVWDNFPLRGIDEGFADAYLEELQESDNEDDGGVDQELGDSQMRDSCAMDLDHQDESTGEFVPAISQPPISVPEKNCSPSRSHETRNLSANVDINHSGVKSLEELRTLRANRDVSPYLAPNRQSNDKSNGQKESERNTTMDPGNEPSLSSFDFLFNGKNSASDGQSRCNNQYLGVQEVCDATSMVAYNLIGRIMEGLAQDEGIDLDSDHCSYLQGDYSAQEVQGETKITSKGTLSGPVVLHVIKDLLPSLPESAINKLKQLLES
ncbi:hypothetical protein Tsubulata_014967 [Turnera subulata]|uniref:Uncharacterized protein n=1 Tax=Turnera subulata TaxID=218843 RepID=A0A9Q0F9H8_9ROSI|nr:hypothetical protein Tsubulata_014967 [Turnera subulata]